MNPIKPDFPHFDMFHPHCGMNATILGTCDQVFDSILNAITKDLRPDVVGGMYNLI